jgi:pimeloyl-ACP methyl ester carboxylesterase
LFFSSPTDELVGEAIRVMSPIEINMAPMMWFYEKEWPSLDLRANLGAISVPVLAVVGEHDWAVPPVQAHFFEATPAGTVFEISNCGHFVQLEAPDTYRQATVEWLNRHELNR